MTDPIVLLVGHGSRTAASIAQFGKFATDLATYIKQPVSHCFLELAEPDMVTGFSEAARLAGDHGRVIVLPIFLGAASHQKNDVAAAVQLARLQFPGVRFSYGTPLGFHAKLIELLELRVQQTLALDTKALPAEESAVLVVGRGSSDPDSNSEIARSAYLLFERRPYRTVEYAFQAVARPRVDEGLRRCQLLGVRQVVVAPYLLFTGEVDQDISQVAGQAASELGLRVLHAPHLGSHPLLLEVAAQRLQEAIEGTAAMTCDICKYRFPMAGYEH